MASGGISLKGWHVSKVQQALSNLLKKALAQSKETFGILMIGETGSGKSTLINNILGKEVAKVGETTYSETAEIVCHEGIVQEVPVRIHDTPGLGDSRGDPQVEESHLREIEEIWRSGKIAMVIFCFDMSRHRMTNGHINTFKTYHRRLELNWKKVIITLTFADKVPSIDDDEPPADVYQRKLKQWKDHIGEVLREKVGVAVSNEDLRILPVTRKYATKLPDGEEWFTPLWLSVVEVLDPHQMFSYLKMHSSRIFCPGEAPSKEEFDKVTQLISKYSDTPLDEQSSSSQQTSSDQQPSSSQQPSSDQLPSLTQQTSSSQQPSSDVGIHDTIINLGPRNIQNVDCPQQADDRQQEYFQRFNAVLERGFRVVLQIPLKAAKSIAKAITWGWDGITDSFNTTAELLQSL